MFRSKGFVWLANKPGLFFEWGQAGMSLNIGVGGPWVATLKENSIEEQCAEKDIGDRAQNLILIGQHMKQNKDLITEALDHCLVTDDEFEQMFKNKLVH